MQTEDPTDLLGKLATELTRQRKQITQQLIDLRHHTMALESCLASDQTDDIPAEELSVMAAQVMLQNKLGDMLGRRIELLAERIAKIPGRPAQASQTA